MGTEALKAMKDQLIPCVQSQLGDISKADTHELGEAVDMIKDLAEAIYYCTITQSMEKVDEAKQGETNINYYTTPYINTNRMYPDYRENERLNGYMYYPSNGGNGRPVGSNGGNNGSTGMNYYTEIPSMNVRDPREGRSPMRRRMYMEGKEMHNDTNSQLRELEAYLQELSSDITEMVRDASPEERATLHQKMMTLANKIS